METSNTTKVSYSDDLPKLINIQHKLYPSVTAIYTKNKKITFQSPPHLKGLIVNNIFDASFKVRGKISFPFSEWELSPPSKYWNVWLYEKRVSEALKQKEKQKFMTQCESPSEFELKHKNSGGGGGGGGGDGGGGGGGGGDDDDEDDEDDDDEKKYGSPFDVHPSKWDSGLVSNWINNGGQPHLKLIEITHFRRYDLGRCFEFLCIWGFTHPQTTTATTASTWLKYSDLVQIEEYEKYLKSRWDIKIEKDKNWEEFEPLDDLTVQMSGGEDEDLPSLGNAYKIEPETERALKFIEQEKKEKRNKRKQRNKRKPKLKRKFVQEGLYGGPPVECEEFDDSSVDSNDDLDKGMDSDDDNMDDENSDDEKLKESKQFHRPDKIKWEKIFGMSSVSPVPRYAIKKFRK
jgi:hypothetical protein